MVFGSDPVHVGERFIAIWWFYSAGIAGACAAGKVPHPILHVDWLRKSTQEIPCAEPGQESVSRGMLPTLSSISSQKMALLVSHFRRKLLISEF